MSPALSLPLPQLLPGEIVQGIGHRCRLRVVGGAGSYHFSHVGGPGVSAASSPEDEKIRGWEIEMARQRRPVTGGLRSGLAGGLLVALLGSIATAPPAQAAAKVVSVAVDGNHLVNAEGQTVRLLGVDRSGPEYACEEGWGIFDGPSNARSVAAMARWHINAVRLPLNEGCWLDEFTAANDPYGKGTTPPPMRVRPTRRPSAPTWICSIDTGWR